MSKKSYSSRVTAAEYRNMVGGKKPPARRRPKPVYNGVTMDSTYETRYARWLDRLVETGQIRSWTHTPVRFRIGEGANYTPDFMVRMPDHSVLFLEMKGYLRREDRVKYLSAAQQYPEFTWTMVMYDEDGRPYVKYHQQSPHQPKIHAEMFGIWEEK
jgi:hypothetical protein